MTSLGRVTASVPMVVVAAAAVVVAVLQPPLVPLRAALALELAPVLAQGPVD
tara:strand:- start:16931 stop:17086 length:156 start_codon:yes stop_codon:yes gene_type:complete